MPGIGGDRKQDTSREAKMDQRHETISLHKIIRHPDKPYSAEIARFERLFRESDRLIRAARDAGRIPNPKDKIKHRTIRDYKKTLHMAEV